MTRRRAALLRAGVTALVASAVTLTFVAPAGAEPGPPSGSGVQPTEVPGNPSCAELTPGTFELRINAPADGTFSDGTLTVTLDVRDTALGQVFDWTSNIGVDSVFVKGGPGGNLYVYDPEAMGDTGLHSPLNPNNDMFFGLSHISFCYDINAAVEVDKGGDELSKVGDAAVYTFTIRNTGDVPITLTSVGDTLLGDLTAAAVAAGCGSLAAGASCTFSVPRTVEEGDPDPLPNTVTVTYSATLPTGAETVTDTDDHSVNLFQPSVTIMKTGDDLSKVGDPVNYTIVVTNTSSADSPNLVCTVTDPLVGIDKPIELAPGATDTTMASRTVQENDPDPLVNTATATCSPKGFPNVLMVSDSHSANLFQPSVAIAKTGDELSKAGDPVDYTIVVTNTSSADSPNLTCTVTDPLLGIIKPINLAPGATDTTLASRTVQENDPDPLVNTASVDCTVDGFPNVLATKTATHSVNLFQPDVEVDKTGPVEATEGETITYTYMINNTGSADSPDLVLVSVTDDKVGSLTAAAAAAGCGTLAPGASCTFTADFTIPVGTQSPLVNVVDVLYNPTGFPNEIRDDDDHEVVIRPPANEGCTPGFWKTHLEAWVGFTPDQTLESVFDVPDVFGLDDATLEAALSFSGGTGTGGAARILLRAAVASLLNAASPDVDFPLTTAQVIAQVNAALASLDRATILALATDLDNANNLGCPIGETG